MVEEHFGIGVVEFMVRVVHCGAPPVLAPRYLGVWSGTCVPLTTDPFSLDVVRVSMPPVLCDKLG